MQTKISSGKRWAERLGNLFTQVRGMVPGCPNPRDEGVSAETIHEALKAYRVMKKKFTILPRWTRKRFMPFFVNGKGSRSQGKKVTESPILLHGLILGRH